MLSFRHLATDSMSIETLVVVVAAVVVVVDKELETLLAAETDELVAVDDDDDDDDDGKENDIGTSLPSTNFVLIAFPYFFKFALLLFVLLLLLLLLLLLDVAGSLFAPFCVIDLATALTH